MIAATWVVGGIGVVCDLVNVLDCTGEPHEQDWQPIGVHVLLFLVILFVFTFLLGREYSREVH